jgi:hypothetical protein
MEVGLTCDTRNVYVVAIELARTLRQHEGVLGLIDFRRESSR